jgi:GntR family transcriptional regulator
MILLDYKDGRPIYEQIVERVEELVAKGVMSTNDQLPSVRQLAMELSINPNTIQRAYTELEHRGSIYSVKGKGSFIAGRDVVVENQKKQLYQKLQAVAESARSLGVAKEEFLQQAAQCYETGGKET